MTKDKRDLGMLVVACDTKRIQTIAIKCRCGATWTERIPGELHDSELTVIFECVSCGRVHALKNHHMTTISKEEYHDRRSQEADTDITRFGINDKQQYDA